jgi:hypothetical protein
MLSYYEDQTPKTYEPPGFIASVFELSNLFHGETARQHFGTACSPHHSIGFGMERLKSAELDPQAVPVKEETQGSVEVVCGSAPLELSGNAQSQEHVKCLCGCNLNDLDMIECDCCRNWQHTVCAGFYSNRDHRIQSTNYLCFECRYRCNKGTIKTLKDVTAYRRTLSIVFNEGISELKTLSGRLGFSVNNTKRQISRMVEDKFVIRPSVSKFTAVKTKEVRDRLRQYFNYDLTKFPELVRPAAQPTTSATQPRVIKPPAISADTNHHVSITDLTLSVSELME